MLLGEKMSFIVVVFFCFLLILFFFQAASPLLFPHSHLSRCVNNERCVMGCCFWFYAFFLLLFFFFRPDAEILTSLPTASVCSLMGVTSIFWGGWVGGD